MYNQSTELSDTTSVIGAPLLVVGSRSFSRVCLPLIIVVLAGAAVAALP